MKVHLWLKHYNHTQNRAKSVSYTSSPFSPYLGALELQFALSPFYTFLSLSLMVLYQLESIHLEDSNLIYSQNKNRGFTEIFTAFPLLYNMILMPSIQILFFSNQFQCIIPQFHKSLTNLNISYKIQHQTLTMYSLDFSNLNLIHFFLNFYQIHHDSTLNNPILLSIHTHSLYYYSSMNLFYLGIGINPIGSSQLKLWHFHANVNLPITLGTVCITHFSRVLTSYLKLSLCTILKLRC